MQGHKVVLLSRLLFIPLSHCGLLGSGTGSGSCVAPPFRSASVQWAGGCPSGAECCTEYGYCHSRVNWESKDSFRDCNGESNGIPLPSDVIRLELDERAKGRIAADDLLLEIDLASSMSAAGAKKDQGRFTDSVLHGISTGDKMQENRILKMDVMKGSVGLNTGHLSKVNSMKKSKTHLSYLEKDNGAASDKSSMSVFKGRRTFNRPFPHKQESSNLKDFRKEEGLNKKIFNNFSMRQQKNQDNLSARGFLKSLTRSDWENFHGQTDLLKAKKAAHSSLENFHSKQIMNKLGRTNKIGLSNRKPGSKSSDSSRRAKGNNVFKGSKGKTPDQTNFRNVETKLNTRRPGEKISPKVNGRNRSANLVNNKKDLRSLKNNIDFTRHLSKSLKTNIFKVNKNERSKNQIITQKRKGKSNVKIFDVIVDLNTHPRSDVKDHGTTENGETDVNSLGSGTSSEKHSSMSMNTNLEFKQKSDVKLFNQINASQSNRNMDHKSNMNQIRNGHKNFGASTSIFSPLFSHMKINSEERHRMNTKNGKTHTKESFPDAEMSRNNKIKTGTKTQHRTPNSKPQPQIFGNILSQHGSQFGRSSSNNMDSTRKANHNKNTKSNIIDFDVSSSLDSHLMRSTIAKNKSHNKITSKNNGNQVRKGKEHFSVFTSSSGSDSTKQTRNHIEPNTANTKRLDFSTGSVIPPSTSITSRHKKNKFKNKSFAAQKISKAQGNKVKIDMEDSRVFTLNLGFDRSKQTSKNMKQNGDDISTKSGNHQSISIEKSNAKLLRHGKEHFSSFTSSTDSGSVKQTRNEDTNAKRFDFSPGSESHPSSSITNGNMASNKKTKFKDAGFNSEKLRKKQGPHHMNKNTINKQNIKPNIITGIRSPDFSLFSNQRFGNHIKLNQLKQGFRNSNRVLQTQKDKEIVDKIIETENISSISKFEFIRGLKQSSRKSKMNSPNLMNERLQQIPFVSERKGLNIKSNIQRKKVFPQLDQNKPSRKQKSLTSHSGGRERSGKGGKKRKLDEQDAIQFGRGKDLKGYYRCLTPAGEVGREICF